MPRAATTSDVFNAVAEARRRDILAFLVDERPVNDIVNALELSQPSATQMHGIAAVGILGFIVVLAVLGRVVLAGTGPFTGQITGVAPAAGGLAVTLSVANEGSNASATTCTIREAVPRFGSTSESVQTARIGAASSIEMTTTVTHFGPEPIALTVSCGSQ